MEIILLRHGKPDIDKHKKISASDFSTWMKFYDKAGVSPLSSPGKDTIEVAENCFVVCSDLPRSLDSAGKLDCSRIDISHSMFREFELPHLEWRFPRLEAVTWSVILRFAWLSGYSNKVESFAEGRSRAHRCAERLIECAESEGRVLFVGHGALIWYLSKILEEKGWRGTRSFHKKYWAYNIYNL